MNFRSRALAYVGAGAAGLFATGAFAAPALAANPDIAVEVVGTTIAADANGKFAGLNLKSAGDAKPAAIDLIFDISKLNLKKVGFPDQSCGEPEDGKIRCSLVGDFIPEPGGTLEFGFLLTRQPGATGDAGELTISAEAEGDVNPDNDSATVKVGVGANGVDLQVVADDVRWSFGDFTDPGSFSENLVQPGGTTAVFGDVFNQGDMTAKGVKVSVTLPKYATFAEVEEGCTYTSDNRTVTCDYTDFSLIPADKETDEGEETAGASFWFPVKIAEGVAAPTSLTDGTFAAFALGAEPYESGEDAAAVAAESLPKVERKSAAEIQDAADVDPTDNTDEFAIFVGEAGGTGGGGDLPVTGVQAGLIGGVGLAVLAGGGALLVMSRRRKIVLVAPGDETPTV